LRQKRRKMSNPRNQSGLGGGVYFLGLIAAGLYFTFASVQGDFGLFNRVRIDAEAEALRAERDRLAEELGVLRNKTRRLSDDYLDLDLLDEQARSVLGLVRGNEVVLR
jgi:cell division protein FtsB